MSAPLRHRGPDSSGTWYSADRSVVLAHRRLAILDLSPEGRQPMQSVDGRFHITYNGEIYNYIELRRHLESKGYTFRSKTDTEVLLAMFERDGPDCLRELDGMFAFAIWDSAARRLFCARDRFGEKPLYYHHLPGASFSFGSELKSLWESGAPRKADPRLVCGFLRDNINYRDPNDLGQTFFENIRQVRPGHFIEITRDLQLSEREYWNLDHVEGNSSISLEDAVTRYRELFSQSVTRRLRSDVPVGSSLSGGIDSSSIVAEIHRQRLSPSQSQHTFSARFPGYRLDEGKFIDSVATRTDAAKHSVFPTAERFAERHEHFFRHHEEPVGSLSIYAQWEVMEGAKAEGITVLLDGQGADESVTGYTHYFDAYIDELRNTDPLAASREAETIRTRTGYAVDLGAPARAPSPSRASRPAKWKTLLHSIPPARNAYYHFRRPEHILSGEYLAYTFEKKPLPAPQETPDLNEALRHDLCGGKLETLLRYSDRNSMAHSREVRLPFLSHELVEFTFSLPSSFKIRNGWSKFLLRKALEPILPSEVCWRTDKIGFAPPQSDWLATPALSDLTNDAISTLKKIGILRKKVTSEQVAHHRWQVVNLGAILQS